MAGSRQLHRSSRLALQPGSRMMPTDALFWYVEEATPELRPVVGGLMVLDRVPDRARLDALVRRWIVRIPRLQQRVVEAPFHLALPEWEDDPNFEFAYHLREAVLPAPGTERQLFDFIGTVFAAPLDHLRPLWEAYLITGLEGGRAACFFKVHHCVMDGVGSMAGFDALTQRSRGEVIHPIRLRRARPPRPVMLRVARLLRDAVGSATAAAGQMVADGVHAVRHPLEAADATRRTLRGFAGMIYDLSQPSIHDPLADPSTGVGRRLDGVTLPLPRLRRIKDALGVTLNDLVLTALAGAVGRYHDHRGVHVDALHCLVPMNLRQDNERDALGNRVGMCNVTLPVAEADPLMRLSRIRQQTVAAKRDRRGGAYPELMRAMAFTPSFVFRLLARNVTGRINLICTNVPGPEETRFLAGAKIEAMYPYAPVAVGTPLSVALLSYGGECCVGIATDPAAIPDPERLHEYLHAAIDEIEGLAVPHSRHEQPTRKPRVAAAS